MRWSVLLAASLSLACYQAEPVRSKSIAGPSSFDLFYWQDENAKKWGPKPDQVRTITWGISENELDALLHSTTFVEQDIPDCGGERQLRHCFLVLVEGWHTMIGGRRVGLSARFHRDRLFFLQGSLDVPDYKLMLASLENSYGPATVIKGRESWELSRWHLRDATIALIAAPTSTEVWMLSPSLAPEGFEEEWLTLP